MFKIVTAFIMKYTGWLKYDRLKGRSDFARCCIIMNGLEMARSVVMMVMTTTAKMMMMTMTMVMER